MNARRITAAALTTAAVAATLAVGAPQAEAVRYVSPQASSSKVINRAVSISTIQTATCNRAKSSCPVTAVLSPGEVGPSGSGWAYVQSGYKAYQVGTKLAVPGGKWFYTGSGTSQWVVKR